MANKYIIFVEGIEVPLHYQKKMEITYWHQSKHGYPVIKSRDIYVRELKKLLCDNRNSHFKCRIVSMECTFTYYYDERMNMCITIKLRESFVGSVEKAYSTPRGMISGWTIESINKDKVGYLISICRFNKWLSTVGRRPIENNPSN